MIHLGIDIGLSGAIAAVDDRGTCSVEIPLRIESTLNKREHWGKRAKRAREHRGAAYMVLRAKPPLLPAAVTITRIAPRKLDDDNLAAGCKALRDGVADWLGLADNDERVTWCYAQQKGKPKQYAVRIEVKEA